MQRPAPARRDPGEGGAGRQAGGPLAGRAARPHRVRVLRYASVKSEFGAAAVKCNYCEVAGGVGRGGGGAAPAGNPGHPRYPGQRQGGDPGLRRALQVSQLSSPSAICNLYVRRLLSCNTRKERLVASIKYLESQVLLCSLLHIYWPFVRCYICFTWAWPFL